MNEEVLTSELLTLQFVSNYFRWEATPEYGLQVSVCECCALFMANSYWRPTLPQLSAQLKLYDIWTQILWSEHQSNGFKNNFINQNNFTTKLLNWWDNYFTPPLPLWAISLCDRLSDKRIPNQSVLNPTNTTRNIFNLASNLFIFCWKKLFFIYLLNFYFYCFWKLLKE